MIEAPGVVDDIDAALLRERWLGRLTSRQADVIRMIWRAFRAHRPQ